MVSQSSSYWTSWDKSRRKNIPQSSVISLHEGICHCNISLEHVPGIFSWMCKCDFVPVTCPCYVSSQCVLHTFLWLQYVAATKPLVSGHLNDIKFQWFLLQIDWDSSIYILDVSFGWVYDVMSASFAYFTHFSNLDISETWCRYLQTVNDVF